ncbi:MAG: CocE/NonD family hydrolase [Gemmatimonadales bacterium]
MRMLFLAAALVACAPPAPAAPPATYERQELTIPMRDGVSLHAVALVPAGRHAPLPIILIRTPFGAANEFRDAQLPARLTELGQDGYLFVTEDIRGRGQSEGTFVTMRPLADSGGTDESTDAWDTIDWLVQHLPDNNGSVAVMGYSYRGWLAAMAGIHPHPALKAIVPEAPMTDIWLGDDFFHQGAFRQTQGAAYTAWFEGPGFEMPGDDEYAYYLKYPTLSTLATATGVTDLPTWQGFREHPARDGYWHARALHEALTRPTVPTLVVGGLWDAEDLFGPQQLYQTLEPRDSADLTTLVLGPWTHGQWLRPGGDTIGPVPLGDATADRFRREMLRPWLAHWLHGEGDGDFPEAQVFETGGQRWRRFDRWPPREAAPRRLYLQPAGGLDWTPQPATATTALAAWTADPADPVPFIKRPDAGQGWATWMVQDQRFLDGRRDVARWISAPLTEDVVIAGQVTAHLVASTTGTDADWVVKLLDVYPDTLPDTPALADYQLMVSGDILRGRYWRGFEAATPIPAGTPTPFTVDLHQQLYRFRKGHRVMVQVQSSWFPLYDRNPQRFVPNIFQATAADFQAQEHRVWAGSYVEVGVELPRGE